MRHIYITKGRLEQLTRFSGRKEAMFEVETVEKYPDDVRVNLLTMEELKDEMQKVWNECADQCAAYFHENGVKATVTPPFESYYQSRLKEMGSER